MSNKEVKGVRSQDEIDYSKQIRDTRTASQKFKDIMKGEGAIFFSISIILCVILDVFMSMVNGRSLGITVWALLTIPFLKKSSKIYAKLPFKKPKASNEIDPNELHPGTKQPMMAEGISYFGNDAYTKEQVWFSSSNIRTHCLIFGTTGGGKTESLLSICMNSLIHASGFIYVDGKADNELFVKLFSMIRRMGREDDILLINYMTGGVNLDDKSFEKLSNTMNPFSDGSASSLSELLISLLPSDGDGMWKGRAAIFMSALMRVLVYLRNQKRILLDINEIRKHFTLEKIEELVWDETIPLKHKDGLKDYLINLPGYQADLRNPNNPGEKQDIDQEVYQQHGFITMQYTESFGLLSDSYGHIMKAQLSDVDFYDIVVNRRFLIVLLPALEKSKQNLINLGKIIVASTKAMMSNGLGAKVEGSVSDIIDTKPTKSLAPYVTVFDEYGYYAVENSAVMPAQARGLGFSMIFAGQDYQAFKKSSPEDAASIVANCAIKMCMKLEDPTETFDIFVKAAGEANVNTIQGLQYNKNSTMGGYADTGSITTTSKQRINIRDLKDQGEGESHILFGDTFIRANMFYANPNKTSDSRINKFLKVPMPEHEEIKRLTTGYNRISMVFKGFLENKDPERKEQVSFFINENNGGDLNLVLDTMLESENIKDLKTKVLVSLYSHIKKQKQIDYELDGDVEALNRIDEEENNFIEDEDSNYNGINYKENEEEGFGAEPGFYDDTYEEEDIREKIASSHKEATKGRNITGKKTGTDKLREILQKSHIRTESGHNSYNPYEEMNLDAPKLQNSLSDLEDKLTKNFNKKGLLDDESRLDDGYSEMATEKVFNDIGLGTSYYNEVRIKPRDQNKNIVNNIIDDIIFTDIE